MRQRTSKILSADVEVKRNANCADRRCVSFGDSSETRGCEVRALRLVGSRDGLFCFQPRSLIIFPLTVEDSKVLSCTSRLGPLDLYLWLRAGCWHTW